MNNLIRKESFEEWVEHPITRKLIEKLKAESKDYKNQIVKLVMGTKTLNEIDNHLSQFKGQYFALNRIIDLEYFMGDFLDDSTSDTEPS